MKKEVLKDFIYVPNSSDCYKINAEKRTVVYVKYSHKRRFIGVAKCLESDDFNYAGGLLIAKCRAEIKQRKYDLSLTREFIKHNNDYIDAHKRFGFDFSPHFMRSIQTAIEEEKTQLKHIKALEIKLKHLVL